MAGRVVDRRKFTPCAWRCSGRMQLLPGHCLSKISKKLRLGFEPSCNNIKTSKNQARFSSHMQCLFFPNFFNCEDPLPYSTFFKMSMSCVSKYTKRQFPKRLFVSKSTFRSNAHTSPTQPQKTIAKNCVRPEMFEKSMDFKRHKSIRYIYLLELSPTRSGPAPSDGL